MLTVSLATPMLCENELEMTMFGIGEQVTHSEDSRRVVVDGIDTRAVLPEEKHTSQEQTPHHVRALGKCLERLPEAETNNGLLGLVGLVNGSNFFRDIEIRGGKLADPAEVVHRLLSVAVEEEPTGRFPNPQRTHKKHTSRNQLDGKWNKPLLTARLDMLLNTILDNKISPVSFG